jgi:tetratricopeptide (TPR) repeat protein
MKEPLFMRIFSLLTLVSVATLLHAQAPGREITGQVRLATQAAPAGVPVVLQIVSGKYVTPSDELEVARTATDAKGKFVFEHLENIGGNQGREFFAVTVKAPGYAPAYRIIDLTLVARGEASLDLQKSDPLAVARPSPEAASSESRAGHQIPSAAAQEHLDRAQELLFRKRDAQASVDEFKQALRIDPWYGRGYVLLGLAFMQMERWADAQLAFSEAVKVEPANAQGFLGLGSALNEQHEYAEAQKALENSLKLKPDSAEAHYELARTLCSLEKWQAAEPHARRAIELNPDYSGPHALMANILLEAQDLAGAKHEFQEYLRLDPDGGLASAARQMIGEIDKTLGKNSNERRP